MEAACGAFKEFVIYSNLILIHLGGWPGPDLFLPYQKKPYRNDDGHGLDDFVFMDHLGNKLSTQ